MTPNIHALKTDSLLHRARQTRVALIVIEIAVVAWALLSPTIPNKPTVIFVSALLISLTAFLTVVFNSLRQKGENEKRELEWTLGQLYQKPEAYTEDITNNSRTSISGLNYITDLPTGISRQIEMLHESSWWSSRISAYSSLITGLASIIALALYGAALSILVDRTQTISNIEIVHSLLLNSFVLISGGKLALATLNFFNFSNTASEIEKGAATLLQTRDLECAIKVYMLLSDYQTARAVSPLLLKPVWTTTRKHLNKQYSNYISALKKAH